MDINSLLSPQESAASEDGQLSANKPAVPAHNPPPPTSAPAGVRGLRYSASSQSMPTPPLSDFPHRPQRQASTSGMDTLADLASMQHHQQLARANAGGLKNSEPYEAQLSSANIRPSLQAIARTHSGSKSSLDIRMADAPADTPPPRVFTAPSLSATELQRVSELVEYLAENSHAYESHADLIKLLHHGLIAHVYPTSSARENEPASYGLLSDLKQAIEAMSSRFSLGEEIWEIKLQVAQLTANNLDDCTALMESFEKAVAEEQSSTNIWALYGEWYLSMYCAGKPSDTAAAELSKPLDIVSKLNEEDLLVLGEVFGRDQMIDVWTRAAEDTKYRLDNGNVVWDKYLDLLLAGLKTSANPEDIAAVKLQFVQRLTTPHGNWEETFQRFSTFISTYENTQYEDTMVSITKQSSKAKMQYSEREMFEIKIRQAVGALDKVTEWACYGEYLSWELSRPRKKKLFQFDLVNALYLRTLIRFPAVVDAWEDYLTFLADEGARGRETASQLSVLGRACDHCSWSGALWSQYILSAESEGLSFADIVQIKHKATSTGLLDSGGIEEVLKIHNALCGCLKRQAFQRDSTDDDSDVAEVGIRSAIEDVETLGKTKYGEAYTGDPQYRLERIYIKLLTQKRNYQGARTTWERLKKQHRQSYEFWLRFYSWEMLVWASNLSPDDQSTSHHAPSEATIVLRQAVEQYNMDWPEKIIETYLAHCEDHENATELQTAVLLCRKAKKKVQERRRVEAAEAAELAQQQAAYADDQAVDNLKRKRENGPGEDHKSKKARTSELPDAPPETTESSAPKRDRENATVIVKNLPVRVTEKRVRHYFNDCGKINSIVFSTDDDTTTATLEFESKEDALTARTKDQKLYEDNIIDVQIGGGATLYVTNFPPAADEGYIRELFEKFGAIVDVRFPSLKFDTHRRFCYVQFQTADEALSATELDGSDIGHDLKLLAKISNPANKQARQGAVYDGREVYVSNVNWNAKEKELEELFSKHGKVEKVRIPRKINGQSKGIAFVVFADKDEALAALALNQAEFQSRALNVEISTANPAKRQSTTVVGRGASPGGASVERPATDNRPSREDIASRTVVLLKVPDTVNDARITELMRTYGELVKVTLRPDHQGAAVEYRDVHAAGKAALEVEGHEIIPGRKLKVGTFEELKHESAEVRTGDTSSLANKVKEHEGPKTQLAQPSAPIRRPGQRVGRRGGLGFKRSNADGADGQSKSASNGSTEKPKPASGDTKTTAKSNADFKAMFSK